MEPMVTKFRVREERRELWEWSDYYWSPARETIAKLLSQFDNCHYRALYHFSLTHSSRRSSRTRNSVTMGFIQSPCGHGSGSVDRAPNMTEYSPRLKRMP